MLYTAREYVTLAPDLDPDLDPVTDGLTAVVSLAREPEATTSTWYPAEWWQDADGAWRVRLLVGPDTTVGPLAQGAWWPVVRVLGLDPRRPEYACQAFTIEGGPEYAPPSAFPQSWYRQLAGNPDALAVGPVTRDGDGAAVGFSVVWPDGSPGVFAGVPSALPAAIGAVDSYTVTYAPAGGQAVVFAQPLLTRDPVSGAVTVRPAIEVG